MEVHDGAAGAVIQRFGRTRDHDTNADDHKGHHAAADCPVDSSEGNYHDNCADHNDYSGAIDSFS